MERVERKIDKSLEDQKSGEGNTVGMLYMIFLGYIQLQLIVSAISFCPFVHNLMYGYNR